MSKLVKKSKFHFFLFLLITILLLGEGISLTSCKGVATDLSQKEKTDENGSGDSDQPDDSNNSGETDDSSNSGETIPTVKKCWKCGKEITENIKFCPNCGADLSKNYLSVADTNLADKTIMIIYYDDAALKISDYLPGEQFSGTIEQVTGDIGENEVYSSYFSAGKTLSYDHVYIYDTFHEEQPADIHTDEVTWQFGFTLDNYPGARLIGDGNPNDGSEYSKLCDCQGYIKINGKIYRTNIVKFYLNMDYIDVKFFMNDGTDSVYFEETIPKEDVIAYGHEGAFAFERIERYPRRKGYVFAGWYYDPECKNNVTVYSQATANGYDVTCYHSAEKLTKHTNYYAKWVANTSGYEPGDIVLSDGTKIDYDKIQSITAEQKAKAVAVISYISEDGTTAYGVGVHQTDNPVYWCAQGVGAYNSLINLEENVIKNYRRSVDSSLLGTGWVSENGLGDSGWEKVFYTGPSDSFKVWENICEADSEGVDDWNVAHNYASFDYVNKYGTTYSLPEQYKTGWFMPHPFDFIKTSRNYDIVSASYNAVSTTPLRERNLQTTDDDGNPIEITCGYWTSMTWLDDINDKAHWAIPYFFGNYENLDEFWETAKFVKPELSLLDHAWGKCGAGEFVVPFRKFKVGE